MCAQILETLVGEIYDEDDEADMEEDTTSIVQALDGTFTIDGMVRGNCFLVRFKDCSRHERTRWLCFSQADLSIVCERLELEEHVDAETRAEYATLSGFLCHQAGAIPGIRDVILVAHIRFDILEADERRVLSLKASNITDARKNHSPFLHSGRV